MKKKEKFYPLNMQEDEDGYAFYANSLTGLTDKKKKQDKNRRDQNLASSVQQPKGRLVGELQY